MSETYRELITTPNPTADTYEKYVKGIEELLSKLADEGVYKGDRGENLKAAPINLLIQPGSTPLTYESFTDEGKELLRAIFDDIDPAEVFVTGGDVNMLKKLEFFNSVNTYTWWCTDGDTDKKVFPSTAFVYIDPNAAVRDIRDYSCLLTPKLELNSSTGKYDLHYSKSEVFPSFWYNPLVFNGKGGWCWKINGVNTDIPASAANDTGEYNNKLFLIRKFTEETTEGTPKETFKYYTSINDIDNGRGGWYTLEDLKDAKKRTPLDGDIGYCLVEVEEPEPKLGSDGQPVLTKINVINLAVYSAGNWLPASIDEKDVLIKFDELFASYIWDCLSHKEVIADNLFIGVSTNKERIHKISVNENNRRQLDFTFTGESYVNTSDGEKDLENLERIKRDIETKTNEYNAEDISEDRKAQLMSEINSLLGELRDIEKKFEKNEEGINFTSKYKHISFGDSVVKDESAVRSRINIYNDTYFRNNVVFDGNATSNDSESSEDYKNPSLTIDGYDHIDISNIASKDDQTVPIHIGTNIGVDGRLSIEGDLEADSINSESIKCNGVLQGGRLNVSTATIDGDGIVSIPKAIISKNGGTITIVPENINKDRISSYLGNSLALYLNSIGYTYLGDYVSYSKSVDSASISRSFGEKYPKYVFGETSIPVNRSLEFTYKDYGVAAHIGYRHFTDVGFNASMSYQIQARLGGPDGTYKSDWITFYSGETSGSSSAGGNNKTWKTTYRYLICSLNKGTKVATILNGTDGKTYYTISDDHTEGKITISPTDNALQDGTRFYIRIIIDSISSSIKDKVGAWKGVGGVGFSEIGIVSNVSSNLFTSTVYDISNYLDLYTIPKYLDRTQTILFSDALLIGSSQSYFYFKMVDNKVRICGSTTGVNNEKSKIIFDPNDPSS